MALASEDTGDYDDPDDPDDLHGPDGLHDPDDHDESYLVIKVIEWKEVILS